MDESENFTVNLFEAISKKEVWLNTQAMPKMFENYQMLHSCTKIIYDVLEKQGMISPDPYKIDQKYEDISLPAEEPFKENETANIMGTRLSMYETMVDFVCSYYKFSTEFLTLDKIGKLNNLNNYILWNSCNPSSPKPNTKALGELLLEIKKKAQSLSANSINDTVNKSADAITAITKLLKDLTDFQKESYKAEIRKTVMSDPNFDSTVLTRSPEALVSEIKKKYQSITGKNRIYTDLIQEIAAEEFSENKTELQQAVLEKLKVVDEEKKPKKPKINPRTILMDTIQSLASLDEEYKVISSIVVNNYHILEGEHNSILNRLMRIIRQAFNLKPKPVMYTIMVEDAQKKTKVQQKLDINIFMNNIDRKSNFYGILADHSSLEYQKLLSSEDEPLFQFATKQIVENKEILTILTALDDFFKTQAAPKNKSKIKGLKMELLTLQNAIIKANQRRAEYCSNIEEITQMNRLGIKSIE